MAEVPLPAWPGGARLLLLGVEGQVPGTDLTAAEAAAYAAFRIEKRRKEWLAGRLAAKRLLAEAENRPNHAAFEIKPDKYGRPCWGDRLVSISHSNDWALAALLPGPGNFLGADIEKVEPRHQAWYRDYFHPGELKAGPDGLPDISDATRVWTIKEALLKALGLGLMADPLSIRTGEKIIFTGKALARHRELGGPAFAAEARPWPAGYWTAVAARTEEGRP